MPKHLVKARPSPLLPRRKFLIGWVAVLAATATARAGNMTLLGVGKPTAAVAPSVASFPPAYNVKSYGRF